MSNNDVLVKALVQVEHDRELHVPGTKSEQFLVDEELAIGLEKSGAVERVRVIDADAVLSHADAHTIVGGADAAGSGTVTFADVADQVERQNELLLVMAERDEAVAKLADVTSAKEKLSIELSSLQAEHDRIVAELEAAKTAVAGQAVGDGTGGDASAAGAADAGVDGASGTGGDASQAGGNDTAPATATTATQTTRKRA